jgi:hypothetical protein
MLAKKLRISRNSLALAFFGLLAGSGCSESNGNPDAGDAGDADATIDAEMADAGPPPGMVGAPCQTDEDCVGLLGTPNMACLRPSWGFTDGYCTIVGAANENACRAIDEASTRVDLPCAEPICMLRCEERGDCRPGYECFLGYQACWPRCEPGRACPFPPPTLCTPEDECDDGDPCTNDGCIGGICAHDRIAYQPRRAARMTTLGPALDVDFTGRIENDNLQLVVAEGEDGVEVFDLSNPTEPRVFYRIDTLGPALSVLREGNRIIVAEADQGFEVFNANNGAFVAHHLIENGEAEVRGLGYRSSNNVLILAYRHGLFTYNSEIDAISRNSCDTRGRAVDALHAGSQNATFVADSLAGLAVCDWNEGTTFATQIARVDTEGRMVAVDALQEILVAAEAGDGFGIFDITTASQPLRRYNSDILDGDVMDVLLAGKTTLAVAASEGGVYLFSIEDCFEPNLWFHWETDGPALALDYTDGVLAIALGEAGIELLDIGCRAPPEDEVEE